MVNKYIQVELLIISIKGVKKWKYIKLKIYLNLICKIDWMHIRDIVEFNNKVIYIKKKIIVLIDFLEMRKKLHFMFLNNYFN